jgi:hypothetical protein
VKEGSIVFVFLHFEPESEVVVLLELGDLLQSFPFYKLADRSAVGDLEQISLEVVVGEAEVEKLFRVFLHLFQLQLHQLLKVFADVGT